MRFGVHCIFCFLVWVVITWLFHITVLFSGKYVWYVCAKETKLCRNKKETLPVSLLRAVKI